MIRVVDKATFIQLLSLNLIRPTAASHAPDPTVFTEWFRKVKSVDRKPQAQIALDYEKDNKGLFRGVEERREEATVQELKRIITRFIGGRTTTRMTKAEAAAVVVKMLEEHQLQYLHFLSVKKLTALVREYVMSNNTRRKKSVSNEIDKFVKMAKRKAKVRGLHPQELNEIVAHLDYIIKVKASLDRAIEMLMEGTAIALDLYDEALGGIFTDIYVFVSVYLL